MNYEMDIITAQSAAIEPEQFQLGLIENISKCLLREAAPPCLLRAPTGAGKTFVISKVLEKVSYDSPTLWFWFVPFANLVQQTEDAIAGNTLGLSPTSLDQGRMQHPTNGTVIISTAQGVARAKSRKEGYTDGEDDFARSLDSQKHRALANGLKIGLVVDEAHIGLDSQTEFGQFAHWLAPDRLLMATATPKDARLMDFIVKAGYSGFESFQVSRDDVVKARLNKRYIEAVVYDLRQSMQTVTDLEQTVLRQAWKRNRSLKKKLAKLDVPVVPLLLVQVGNGPNTVAEARKQLMELCDIPLAAIGEHSSDEPNPVLMASIANDSTKEVLIFKQSAGTGFDAPRAFVLASTKPVNDPDFAAQFIGRVMRVHKEIRAKFPRPMPIDEELNTAYIYLANAEAQQGFEQAVASTAGLRSQLEGQSEKLVARKMTSGALVYTNREEPALPLFYDAHLPDPPPSTPVRAAPAPFRPGFTPDLPGFEPPGASDSSDDSQLDRMVSTFGAKNTTGATTPSTLPSFCPPKTRKELLASLPAIGLRAYPKRSGFKGLPDCLKTELRPEMGDMAAASKMAATRLTLTPALQSMAIATALGRIKEREIHTELTTHSTTEQEVFVVVSRTVLAREAWEVLRQLPQVEDEDAQIIIDVLTKRLRHAVEVEMERPEDDPPEATEINRFARDAAYAVIRREHESMSELLHEEIAAQAMTVDAMPLPDAMVFANEIGLDSSTKNIYGVLPPSKDDIANLSNVLTIDVRAQLVESNQVLKDGPISLAPYDGAHALGQEERAFAKALDRASFVQWWHRNPDRKGYSVRIVRGEHKNYFYPDFIVCLEHFPGDEPIMRLVETKESVKDATRKAKRPSPLYGKVLFLTKDLTKWKLIKDDGTLGDVVDLDDLTALQDWLRSTIPT